MIESMTCPKCSSSIEYSIRKGIHICTKKECSWENTKKCIYPRCGSNSWYPSELCHMHSEQLLFICWASGIQKSLKEIIPAIGDNWSMKKDKDVPSEIFIADPTLVCPRCHGIDTLKFHAKDEYSGKSRYICTVCSATTIYPLFREKGKREE